MNFLPSMLLATTLIGGSCNIQTNMSGLDMNSLQNLCKENSVNCQVYVGNWCDLESILDCFRPSSPGSGDSDNDVDTPDLELPGSDAEMPDIEFPGNESETPDVELPGDNVETPDTEIPGNDAGTPGEEIPDEEAEAPDNKPENPDADIPDRPETPDAEVPGSRPETPGSGSSDNIGQEAVKSYVEQVVTLVNIERAKVGLPALNMSEDLNRAAQIRARETVQSFSHTRPNGSSFSSVLKENGISYRGAGENIAWGQRTPEAVVNAWMNSEGHRANILNKNYTSIGVGYHLNGSTPYWTQLFTY